MDIKFADTDNDILSCFELMSDLRPHLQKEEFVALVRELMQSQQYRLIYLTDNGIKSVMGIRLGQWLHTGKYLEIEELITSSEHRSQGYGEKLMDWAKAYAKDNQCNQMRLVSGVTRERAHSFYQGLGMSYEAKYFSINV